jgi:hypothetical protein
LHRKRFAISGDVLLQQRQEFGYAVWEWNEKEKEKGGGKKKNVHQRVY